MVKISETFQSRWSFPDCLGLIDGKYIQIRLPPGTASEYFNCKKNFSLISLAIARPDYECIYADIGSNRRMNDPIIWNSSDLCRKIEDNCHNMRISFDNFLQKSLSKNNYTRRTGTRKLEIRKMKFSWGIFFFNCITSWEKSPPKR